MDSKETLGVIPVVLAFVSYGLYLRSVVSGSTKPHMYSWLLWSILAAVGFFGQVADGAGPGAWNTGITAIGCFVIFLLGIKSGDKSLSRLDKSLLAAAFLSVLVLILSSNDVLAVTVATLTALVGFFFTNKKAFKNPAQESWPTFSLNASRNIISIFALSSISFLTFFYPICMALANISVVFIVLVRRKVTTSKAV